MHWTHSTRSDAVDDRLEAPLLRDAELADDAELASDPLALLRDERLELLPPLPPLLSDIAPHGATRPCSVRCWVQA